MVDARVSGGKDDPQSSGKQMAKDQWPPETRKWLSEQASCVFSSGQLKKKKKLLLLIILLYIVNLYHFLSFLLKMLYFYSLSVSSVAPFVSLLRSGVLKIL